MRRLWPWPVLIVLFVWTLTTHGKYSDSGDEPHYLMIAESLVADGDFDLADNYGGASAKWFGADGLEHGPHALRTRQGALWSVHDFGLPVLLLPVYAPATRISSLMPDAWLARMKQTRGLFAYSLVSLTMTVATALAAALLISGLERRTSPGLARAVGMAVALSPPVVSHSFLVFPETPALWATCAAIWLVCLRADELTRARVLAVVIAIGLTPWLHRKYSLYSLALIAWIVYVHRDWVRAQAHGWLAAVVAASVLPQIGLHAVTLWAWGHLGGPQMLDSLPFTPALMLRGALGLLFDRERGLLGYAPIYLLAPACFALAWREHRAAVAVAAALFVPMAAYANWGAGFSPAARYIVPLMPLFAFPAARALQNRAFRRWVWPVLAFQAVISAVIWQFPRAMWPKELGTNQALDKIPILGPAWSNFLPSLYTNGPTWRGAIPVIVVASLTVVIVRYAGTRGTSGTRGPGTR